MFCGKPAPLDVSGETKLKGFFGARFSEPFICECLVQPSQRPDLIWPMWQRCDMRPRSLFKEGLVPHLQGVLSAGSLQLTALSGNCPSCRQPVHLRSFLSMGSPIPRTYQCKGTKLLTCPSQDNSEGLSNSKAPMAVAKTAARSALGSATLPFALFSTIVGLAGASQ